MSKNKFIMIAIMIIALFPTASCDKFKGAGEGKEVQSQTADMEKSFEGCFMPGTLSQEDALKSLRILVKGDHDKIPYYGEYERFANHPAARAETTYQNDICEVVKALSQEMNIEAYDLILRVIERKKDYPVARVCAIKAIMIYGEIIDGKWHGDKESVPALRKAVREEDPDIRLNAAAALLSLEEGDIALPILEEFARGGTARSIPALDSLFAPEQRALRGKVRVVLSNTLLFDERGKDILISALNYSGNELRVFAAMRLSGMGIEEKRAEETAIDVIENLRQRKRKDYKQSAEWQADRRSLFHAIELLEKINSEAGIGILEKYADNTDDRLLQKRAETALNSIQRK